MPSSQRRLISVAERLIADRRYREALLELESVDLSQISDGDYGVYCLLLSQAKLFLGDYRELPIDEAIDIYRHSADTAKYALSKYLKGWQLVSVGKHEESLQELLEAYASFLRCNDLAGAARALNRISFVTFQLGRLDTAAENSRKCAAIYESLRDYLNFAVASMNLAMFLMRAGHLNESIDRCRACSPQIADSDTRNNVILFEVSALPLALRGDLDAAKATIAKCVPYLDTYPREKAIYFENLGLIHILAGEYPQARKALLEGLALSLKIAPESALVSQTKRLLADLHIALQKYDLARQYAKQALEVAEKIGQKVEIAACWRVFAQVETHRKNDKAAREWYRKALDMFNLISSRYELAVTRYLAACSGLFTPSERNAYLFLAKEYFDAEDVAPYKGKVAAALEAGGADSTPLKPITRSQNQEKVLIAVSPRIVACVETARHVAPLDMTVLLTGETGVGKDHLAWFIHEWSARPGRFVSVNAAAVPDTVAETLLFGVRRGAFTGADQDRPGLFEEAHQGTLYLNEVADTSMEFQAKLLEVLDGRPLRRLGDSQTREVDFRLIAATNHDLKERIAKGLFRADLYYRLHQACIELPPLRDRRDDLGHLVRQFLSELGYANGHPGELGSFVRALVSYEWPGNVRELNHLVSRLWVNGRGDIAAMTRLASEELTRVDECELETVLAECGGNQREAARRLGVSEGTVRYRLRKRGE